jgi:hypothetical protein
VFEINVSVGRPKALLQFIACDRLTGVLNEHCQYADGLALEFYPQPTLA